MCVCVCVRVGLLWTKQFYHYIVEAWVDGDPDQPTPAEQRKKGRNAQEWRHLFNRDVISMPDKWEYPWVRNTLINYSNEGCSYYIRRWVRGSMGFRTGAIVV